MNKKTTLVLGASENPERYSNMAINRLRTYGHAVAAIGARPGQVADVVFGNEPKAFEDIDTVTLYLSPARQQAYYDYILSLKPRRIIFNPGTENVELRSLAQAQGIETIEACTLVMLGTGQY
jgi:predicted CoA-binding protein